MDRTQALVNVLIAQRNEAMNKLADTQASLAVALAEIEALKNPPDKEGDP